MRRWEEKEGLPVHRLQHDKRGSIYAYATELDTWRESRRHLVEAEGSTSPATASSERSLERRIAWPWSVVAAIVLAVVAGVGWAIVRPAPRAPDPEAVRLVGLANFSGNAGRQQIETGLRYLSDAIARDPGYARAWSGLAIAQLVHMWFSEQPAREAAALARKSASEAIRLDPSSGAPWRVLAFISHVVDFDHQAAEAQFRKAVAMNPKDPVAHSWFGDFLVDMRRFEEARAAYRRAQEAAPRWLEPIAFAGNVLFFTGHPELAVPEYRRVLDSEPSFGLANHFLGRALIATGEYEQGIDRLRRSNELLGHVPFAVGDLGYALGVAGRREEAEALRAQLTERRQRGYYPAFPLALIEIGMGHTEPALEWFEQAIEERQVGFYLPSADPTFDALRGHPRFEAAMRRLNLEGVQPPR